VKILAAQLSVRIGDLPAARTGLLAALDRAREVGAQLVVTPELALGGYPPRDLLDRVDVLDAIAALLTDLAEATRRGPALLVGAPLRDAAGRLRNAAVLIDQGVVIARHDKALLPAYDIFDEPRYFAPGSRATPVDFGGHRLLLTICEDIWFGTEGTESRYDADPLDGCGPADLVINLSASPFSLHKPERRRRVVERVAQRLQCPVLYVNQAGANDEVVFDGASLWARPGAAARQVGPSFEPGFIVIDTEQPDPEAFAPPAGDEHATYLALLSGIGDYVRRTGFERVVLGLSGGIDSALVATLAADALGPDRVTGLLMPSRFSSHGSLDDARELAQRLGIHTHEIPIEPAHVALLGSLGGVADELRGLTEENLQARIRGVLCMAVANQLGALVLTTGNKSELSVGYCTLYGDMCGALAPIADLFKTRVWSLARWINRDGVRIPVASIEKPPSAELRPNQTDQDSLPPYDLLDAILARYVERAVSVDAILAEGFDPAVVRRVARLVDISEFKRRQAAPAIRISDKAFGVGRRYPIAALGPSGI
jgi:NAD+ synthetase